MRKPLALCAALFLLLAIGTASHAERSHRDGDYIVHYNALPTTVLGADVATRYGITRSSNRGFVNIAILRGADDGTGVAVPAKITMTARSLIGQTQDIPLREIRDQDAIYYVGEFTMRGKEHLRFELSITPDGKSKVIPVRFEQAFDAR